MSSAIRTDGIERGPLDDHFQQRGLLGAVGLEPESTPAHHVDQLGDHGRGEIGAVRGGFEFDGVTPQSRELSSRPVDLGSEGGFVPAPAGVEVLDRLVGLEVEAPVEVEGGRLEPVALAERVGESVECVTRRVDTDEVEPRGRRLDIGDGR